MRRFLSALLGWLAIASAVHAGPPVFPVPAPAQVETMGAKLRRLAAAAQTAPNPFSMAPLIVPPAWTTGEAVTSGVVRSSGGSWYVAASAGVCGATAPTIKTSGNVNSDGAVTWEYIGGALSTASDPDAPAVSVGAFTSFTATYTQYVDAVNNPNLFKITGGYSYATEDSTFVRLRTYNRIGTTSIGHFIGVEFVTDAPAVVVFQQTGGTPIRIEVDGRFVSAGNTPANGTAKQGVLVDFSGTSGRKRRTWRVYGAGSDFVFGGIRLLGYDTVYPPSATDGIRAYFIGDSTWEGTAYGPFRGGGSMARQVARLLGWSDPWSASIGGTGDLNPNATSGPFYTYGQRIPEGITRNPDDWVIAGSINDRPTNGYTLAQKTAAVAADILAIRAASSSPIFVLGIWPVNDSGYTAGNKNTDLEAAQIAGIAASGAANVFFVPMAGDTPPWVVGTWNNSFNTTANNAAMYIGGDSIHPPEFGIQQAAARAAAGIRKAEALIQ